MELLGRYRNGNYVTTILSDGTRIREINDDEFIPDHAENMDIKITNCCLMSCPFCHEGSTKDGKHGDILNEKFIETLHPFQECAIGGGNILEHPDLIPFLEKLKEKKVIANITVNQIHFEKEQKLIKKLVDEKLIYGLGVSLVKPTDKFINLIKQYPNAVVHVINGVLTESDVKAMKNNNLKMLILGYKHLRRGNEYFEHERERIEANQNWLYESLDDITCKFKVVSFDNLAIEQLNVKRLMSDKEWDEFYQGDDGSSTYYIDMVERKFARSSTAPFNKRYDLLDSVDEMFKAIRNENN
jgi:organic radical activating enzyme